MPKYPVVEAIKAEIFGSLIEALNELEEKEADAPGTPLTAGKLVTALWEAEERARRQLTIEPSDVEKAEAAQL